jgi:hypothetical protein
MKITRTYLYITCNKKILLLKNILAYCGYSPISPSFLLLSEHKHCDFAATNSNSENARRRMVATLWGSVSTEKKEYESSTGHVWTAGFHHSTCRAFLNLRTLYFFNFPFFSGCGQQRITETADTESANTTAHLYSCIL